MANVAAAETVTGRFHPNPELSYTLPAHYYYDPQIFEREKQEIWFKTWTVPLRFGYWNVQPHQDADQDQGHANSNRFRCHVISPVIR